MIASPARTNPAVAGNQAATPHTPSVDIFRCNMRQQGAADMPQRRIGENNLWPASATVRQ